MNINKTEIIGMIHLPPTVSYLGWKGIEYCIKKAIRDLKALENGGASAALIENDGDSPCKLYGEPDVIAPMSIVAHELSKIAKIPLGIEVLLNDPKSSLMIAKTVGLQFIRTDYFVDRMTRKGYGEFKIDPKGLINIRKQINGESIKIFTDVQVKYATMKDKKKTISQSVSEALIYGSDGVIISGTETGEQPLIDHIKEAKQITKGKIPVIVGSGFSVENAEDLLSYADWAMVGTSIKTNNYIDIQKIEKLMQCVQQNIK